jgi:hypothetical protein
MDPWGCIVLRSLCRDLAQPAPKTDKEVMLLERFAIRSKAKVLVLRMMPPAPLEECAIRLRLQNLHQPDIYVMILALKCAHLVNQVAVYEV